MKQDTVKLKELAYIYKKIVELRSIGLNNCASTGNALSAKIDVAQQSTPCRNSRFTSPAMHFYPLVGDQCPHRRHERACPQSTLHLL